MDFDFQYVTFKMYDTKNLISIPSAFVCVSAWPVSFMVIEESSSSSEGKPYLGDKAFKGHIQRKNIQFFYLSCIILIIITNTRVCTVF